MLSRFVFVLQVLFLFQVKSSGQTTLAYADVYGVSGVLNRSTFCTICLESLFFFRPGITNKRIRRCLFMKAQNDFAGFLAKRFIISCPWTIKHAFHGTCLIEWTFNRDYCPVCREKFPDDFVKRHRRPLSTVFLELEPFVQKNVLKQLLLRDDGSIFTYLTSLKFTENGNKLNEISKLIFDDRRFGALVKLIHLYNGYDNYADFIRNPIESLQYSVIFPHLHVDLVFLLSPLEIVNIYATLSKTNKKKQCYNKRIMDQLFCLVIDASQKKIFQASPIMLVLTLHKFIDSLATSSFIYLVSSHLGFNQSIPLNEVNTITRRLITPGEIKGEDKSSRIKLIIKLLSKFSRMTIIDVVERMLCVISYEHERGGADLVLGVIFQTLCEMTCDLKSPEEWDNFIKDTREIVKRCTESEYIRNCPELGFFIEQRGIVSSHLQIYYAANNLPI